MGCPRNPIEIVDGVQTDCDGKNVDAPIRETVAQIMEQICQEKIECAILQSRSPTCGVNQNDKGMVFRDTEKRIKAIRFFDTFYTSRY